MITLLLKHQLSMRRWLLGALLAVISVIAAPPQAHAMNTVEAMDKVCSLADGAICGPAYKSVSNNCFHSSDELACAISIVGAVSGSDIPSTLDVILNCAQEGLPISQKCLALLNSTGLDTTKINEAQKIITHCASILSASGVTDAIDDAIVCADMVLDSSIAKDADLTVPTWVNSLFDVYMAIRDKDFWMLLAKVGETVACALIDYFLCVDLCSYLGEIYAAGKVVVDTANDIGQGKTPDWVPAPIKSALNSVRKACDSTMPTTKYHELYFAPAIDTVVVGMQKNLSADSWTPVVKPRWNQCKNYYHTRSFAPHDWCKNGEAVAQEYCDRIRDNMFHPAVMHRYFTLGVVDRYLKLAEPAIAKIQSQFPQGAPNMRLSIVSALGLRMRTPTELDYGTGGSTIFARAESYVREPYFKAVAKGTHNTGIVHYEFPVDIEGAAKDLISTDAQKAMKATKTIYDSVLAAGCEVADGKFVCGTLSEINACRKLFAYEGPCIENKTTAAQDQMLKWHREKRFALAGLTCSYDIFWNANAIGCNDPSFTTQCNALLKKEFHSSLGLPKPGVMDCQTRVEKQEKKWADLLPQLAEILTPGFVLNLNTNTPAPPSKIKYRSCKVDANDPLIVRCPGDPIATNHQNFQLAEQLIGKGNAGECTPAQVALSPHWVDKPCVIWDRKSAVIAVLGVGANATGVTVGTVGATVGGAALGAAANLGKPPPLPVPPVPVPPVPVLQAAPPVLVVPPAFKPPAQIAIAPPLGSAPVLPKPAAPVVISPPISALSSTPLKPPSSLALVPKPIDIDGCSKFLGRADELLCNTDRSFAQCKPLVDSAKLKTCRRTGVVEAYQKR